MAEQAQGAGPGDRQEDNPHAASVRTLATAMLRMGLRIGLAGALLAIAVSWVLLGWPGLASAAVGALVAFGSSLVTVWMMHKTAALPPEMLFGLVLGGYILKLGALLVVMLTLRGVEVFDPVALGVTMLVTVLAWAAAEVVAFQRAKIPTVIPETRDEG
ncbi:hypothetical protein SAMN06265360_11880 [Haloechinothrix alba]|uniref:ATP synthase protein I n=1 Tax=Haloechinothrix alba TaxID=664784 RepID=A0A238Z1U7_9PSEU|nr:hypothetical protein [Haloechinothrix alba]SNR77310.1 hypothetical protein SAMN06265360_11880 [Haloechinothrix alba]